jgi:hypothetical protein
VATTDLIGTPERAVHPTAPLPSAAVEALARLQRGYVSEADRLSARLARLSAAAQSSADFDRLLCVQDELAMCRCHPIEAAS